MIMLPRKLKAILPIRNISDVVGGAPGNCTFLGYTAALSLMVCTTAILMTLNHFCYFLLVLAAVGSAFMPHSLVMWFVLVNVLTLLVYGGDKLAAVKAWRRVPETTLLIFGLLGGWPGAIFAQQLFRHKTQKQPFKSRFFLTVIINIIFILIVTYEFYLSH